VHGRGWQRHTGAHRGTPCAEHRGVTQWRGLRSVCGALVEYIRECLKVADGATEDTKDSAKDDEGARHVVTRCVRQALLLLHRQLLVSLDGLFSGGDVHEGGEDVDDAAAQDGAGKGRHEAKVAQHHRHARREQEHRNRDEVLGGLGGIGVAGGGKEAGAEAVEAERVAEEDGASRRPKTASLSEAA